MAKLTVVTPEGAVAGLVDREVDEVTAPGALGEFGVLDGHIPMVSMSKAGVLHYRRGAERGKVAVGPGFVEVDGQGGVDVMVQRALPGGDVDVAAAEKLHKEAEGRLKKAQDAAEERAAQADLAWAEAQLGARS